MTVGARDGSDGRQLSADPFVGDDRAWIGPFVFSRVVIGVEGAEPGFEACRQAARLVAPGAWVEAVSVVHLADAIWTGGDAPRVVDRLQAEATEALEQAVAILGSGARTRFVNGYITAALLREVELARATVLAIGTHEHHRATEIVFGGVAGELLHRAPCSVLVARAPAEGVLFPVSVVAGIDGSPGSESALAVATHLAGRLSAPLRVLVAVRGKGIRSERVPLIAPQAELVDETPVDALVAGTRPGDLLVVGSRGLHGLRALGSVSERVAHQAACSVLVVRPGPAV